MSSGSAIPPVVHSQTPVVVAPPSNDCEGIIELRLRQTRRQVKTVDIAVGLVALAIGVLAYLFVAVLVDHWLIVGGLGTWGRLLLWLVLVAAGGTYFVLRLFSPLVRRINPVFAAATIEKSQLTLKNSLVNFLLLRGHRNEVAAPIYNAMESRAASDLSNVQVDVAVDRTHLVRLGCVLAATVTVFSIYLVVSPKNPLRSVARVLLPWAAIEPPTRVTIRDVQPGETAAFHGESVNVSAEVAGLRKGEPILLIVTSADGQIVEQTIPMSPPESGLRYQCQFPPGKLGLQQDYEYYLAGGDCQSPRYRITAQTAPAVVIDSVAYHYPAYTGIADRVVERQGDLRAIEGAKVTIRATANTEIKPNSAEIDLGCTGRRGVSMTTDAKTATGQFTLRLMPEDPSRPNFDSYQLRIADIQGHENPKPIRHTIDVIRDQPPEIQLVDQPQEEIQVAENGKLEIKVRADDPDFGLRRVSLRAEREGRSLLIPPLLEKRLPEKALPGEFVGTCTFEPAKLGLKAGDRVQYWAEAEDNREPVANRTATDKRWIVVVQSQRQAAPQEPSKTAKDDQAKSAEKNRSPDGGKSADGKSTNDEDGKSAENKSAPDDGNKSSDKNAENSNAAKDGNNQNQQSEQPTERVDPKTDPGGAMQEILKDREKQQGKQKQEPEGQKGDSQKSEAKKGDDQQGTGGKNSDSQKAEGKKGDDQQGAGGQKGENQKSDGQKGDSQESESKKSDDQQGTGGQQGENQKTDGQKSDSQKTEGNKDKDQQGAGGEKGESQKNDGQKDGSQKTKDRKGENQQGAGGQKGDGKKNEGQKGENQSGADGQSGDSQQGNGGEKGDSQKADGQKSEGQGTDGQKGEDQKADGQKGKSQKSDGKQGKDQQGASDQKSDGQKTDGQKSQNQQQTAGVPKGENQKSDGQKGEDQQGNGQQGKEPSSPSTDQQPSDAKGTESGDRTADDKVGKAPKANRDGTGASGAQSPADAGSQPSNEQGKGDTTNRPGSQATSKQPTGSEKKQPGSGKVEGGKAVDKTSDTNDKNAAPGHADGDAKGKPSDAKVDSKQKSTQRGDSDMPGTPGEKPTDGQTPGKNASEGPKANGSGSPTTGGVPGEKTTPVGPAEAIETPADQANLEYARRQTELALEHLRDQLAKEKPDLLDKLGWTKEEASQFLERWERMQRLAAEKGTQGEAARKEFSDAIRSLGLRPRGTELHRGGVTPDQPANLRDSRRLAPPPDWAEQFRAYTRGVSGADRDEKK